MQSIHDNIEDIVKLIKKAKELELEPIPEPDDCEYPFFEDYKEGELEANGIYTEDEINRYLHDRNEARSINKDNGGY